ncbi:hypothetical protein GTPT_2300 [Tatumella ptyseos ATCC 33301]|uniref:Uncharacterized protein n=1 Tax=Tatumella ptyseos ATCC 33301 TaxID=1005995 RepID=A0A085JEV3_9GAMM|nr:hypothetical protein GTPT_2300 [Tatumella ptyseos ATCC 33301]
MKEDFALFTQYCDPCHNEITARWEYFCCGQLLKNNVPSPSVRASDVTEKNVTDITLPDNRDPSPGDMPRQSGQLLRRIKNADHGPAPVISTAYSRF